MRTDRRGARLYYHALAALLFAAVCAWLGAAVFGALAVQDALREETPPVPGRLRGILLRRERALSPEEIPAGAEDGMRLSAAETGSEAGLFLSGADGLEDLSPEDAAALTPETLDVLLARKAERDADAGRLVPDFACCCAAFCEGGEPAPGPCRVCIDGAGEYEGRVVSAARDEKGRTALLIRIPEGDAALYRLRFVTGEVRFAA